MFAALSVLRPPAPPTVLVTIARHDLAAGARIAPGDIAQAAFPASLAPAHLAKMDDVIGQTVTSAVSRGAPLTRLNLSGDAWASLTPGRVAVPVRLQDGPAAGLLRSGQHLRLVTVDPHTPGSARIIVDDAVVLAVPRPEEDSHASQPGRLVVFDVPDEQSDLVVSAAVSRYLTVIWGR